MNSSDSQYRPRIKWKFLALSVLFTLSTHSVSQAQLQYPIDVAVAGEDILVVDRTLPGLQKIDGNGTLSVVFQASRKFRTPLNGARSVVVDPQGRILVGDSATRQIYVMENGKPVPLLTNSIGIGIPYAMTFDPQGNLYVADLEPPGRIYRLAPGETSPQEFAIQPGVRGLAIDGQGNLIAVTGLADALLRFAPDGKKTVILGNRPFRFPNAVVSKGDDLYVSDSYSKCIWKVDSSGQVSEFCKSGLTYPGGMAVHGDNLLVTDSKDKKIYSVSPDGKAAEISIK